MVLLPLGVLVLVRGDIAHKGEVHELSSMVGVLILANPIKEVERGILGYSTKGQVGNGYMGLWPVY